MGRYPIDTTSSAELLLRGLQTGGSAAATRLAREQAQRQFEADQAERMRQFGIVQAERQRQILEAKQRRMNEARALHAAVIEQLARTAAMRQTFGNTPGMWAPGVLNQPVPDEWDEKWKRAADYALEVGDVEGLEALLREGDTREKRVKNEQIIRYIEAEFGGDPSVLADPQKQNLIRAMKASDDPGALVEKFYAAQEAERRRLEDAARRDRLWYERDLFNRKQQQEDQARREEAESARVGRQLTMNRAAVEVRNAEAEEKRAADALEDEEKKYREATGETMVSSTGNERFVPAPKVVEPTKEELAMAAAMRLPEKERAAKIDTGILDFTGEFDEDDAKKAQVKVEAWEKYDKARKEYEAARDRAKKARDEQARVLTGLQAGVMTGRQNGMAASGRTQAPPTSDQVPGFYPRDYGEPYGAPATPAEGVVPPGGTGAAGAAEQTRDGTDEGFDARVRAVIEQVHSTPDATPDMIFHIVVESDLTDEEAVAVLRAMGIDVAENP